MIKATTWNIHDLDGRYVGQSSAFAVETALCQYLRNLGKAAVETDIEINAIDGGAVKVTHWSTGYFLIPMDPTPINTTVN